MENGENEGRNEWVGQQEAVGSAKKGEKILLCKPDGFL